ncbi:hypothetical protein ANCCAN_05808 [Ancylostoma caninum]|uniref:7TM GPCR serpentine receptor class x (Srx) domain-containing protein n=1 Tax=Ancylostoma caninum TaxID=29170 RepID=A0A368GUS6_ANCCA|nr:hypothetical protein ANCCAN_05808 [Ancylostoma caninum]
MNSTTQEISELRLPFFILYIVVGCVFLLLHLRFVMIIQSTRSLVKLPAYRCIQHASIACFINITTQIIVVAFTISQNEMNYTLNTIIGAIFQGSWAAEYPMLLILAGNRLLSVASPVLVNRLCDLKSANAVVALCWSFGLFNAILCLSGQVQTLWIPTAPGFAFTEGTFLASFLFYMDFYFAEFVVVSSLICYISILIIFLLKVYTE